MDLVASSAKQSQHLDPILAQRKTEVTIHVEYPARSPRFEAELFRHGRGWTGLAVERRWIGEISGPVRERPVCRQGGRLIWVACAFSTSRSSRSTSL